MRTLCPACQNPKFKDYCPAIISPWIRELADVDEIRSFYRVCQKCGSGYATHSYSDLEMSKIYSGYRGDKYVRIRQKWEPSYTLHLNRSLDSGSSSLTHRRNQLTKVINHAAPGFSEVAQNIIDIGGGHGGVIPEWPQLEHKYVLDVSDSDTKAGVQRISSWEKIQRFPIDLVMACGILEHLNSPLEFLSGLVNEAQINLQNNNSKNRILFYLEVPAGIPSLRADTSQVFFRSLSRFKTSWKIVDFLQTNGVLGKGPLRIAEHLQFFTIEGLSELVKVSGLQLLYVEEYRATLGVSDVKGMRFENGISLVAQLQRT